MTALAAKRAALKMWRWLAKTGLEKNDYFTVYPKEEGKYILSCPLCDYFNQECAACPLDCTVEWVAWCTLKDAEDRKNIAAGIVKQIEEWKL
jgi:hypothetical protein